MTWLTGWPRPSLGNSTYVQPRRPLRQWAMDIYDVETDGMGGFVVKVAKRDGKAYLTSPSLPALGDTRKWIDEHRKSAAAKEWPDPERPRSE